MKNSINLVRFIPTVLLAGILAACGGGGGGSSANNADGNSNTGGNGSTGQLQITTLKTYVDPNSSLEWATIEITADGRQAAYSVNDAAAACNAITTNNRTDWRIAWSDEIYDFMVNNIVVDQNGNFVTKSGVDLRPVGRDVSPITLLGKGIALAKFDPSRFSPGYVPDPVAGFKAVINGTGVSGGTVTAFDQSYFSSTGAIMPIYEKTADSKDEHYLTVCVRGTHRNTPNNIIAGTWVNIADQSRVRLSGNQYVLDYQLINSNHVRLSTLSYDYINGLSVPGTADYLLAGIIDVKLKGVIKPLTTTSSQTAAARLPAGAKAALKGIGGIGLVLGCIKNKEPEYCKRFDILPSDPNNPHNSYTPPASEGDSGTVYLDKNPDGSYRLDNNSPITFSSGETEVTLIDSEGNEAFFTVELLGLETDMGILNIPEKRIKYNFKSSIVHGNDYVYFGYNDGEAPLSYQKTLKICNVGSADISGMTLDIKVASEDAALVRNFSHDYTGTVAGFAADTCKNVTIDIAFNRPVVDDDVKIEVTITDNFNNITWNDYASLKLSQYPPLPLYMVSSAEVLQGYLIAPGNQLIRVTFSPGTLSSNNFLRIPKQLDTEYNLVMATTSVAGEDTYMISTVNPPDTTRMSGFSNVTAYEPNNNQNDATVLPVLYADALSYLHSGDLDFYILKDVPQIQRQIANLFVDDNIVIPFNTQLDANTVSGAVAVSIAGAPVAGVTSYDASGQQLIFTPSASLPAGTLDISLAGSLASSNGIALGNTASWQINISDYPANMSTIGQLNSHPAYTSDFSLQGIVQGSLLTHSVYSDPATYDRRFIYDVSDKSNPYRMGTHPFLNAPEAISSTYCAYVDRTSGGVINRTRFELYDCSSSNDIRWLSSTAIIDDNAIGSDTYITDIVIRGSMLYAFYTNGAAVPRVSGLVIYDISTPTTPQQLSSIDSSTLNDLQNLIAAELLLDDTGNRLFISNQNRIVVIDVSTASSPAYVTTITLNDFLSPHQLSISADGSHLYGISARYNNTTGVNDYLFTSIDISNINAAQVSLVSSLPQDIQSMWRRGSSLFAVDINHNLHAIDISTASNPVLSESYSYSASPASDYTNYDHVMAEGNFAYVANMKDKRIEIINIQNHQ